MMNQSSSYSADSLNAPSCRGHSFPCSSLSPCNNCVRHDFSRFWDGTFCMLFQTGMFVCFFVCLFVCLFWILYSGECVVPFNGSTLCLVAILKVESKELELELKINWSYSPIFFAIGDLHIFFMQTLRAKKELKSTFFFDNLCSLLAIPMLKCERKNCCRISLRRTWWVVGVFHMVVVSSY